MEKEAVWTQSKMDMDEYLALYLFRNNPNFWNIYLFEWWIFQVHFAVFCKII